MKRERTGVDCSVPKQTGRCFAKLRLGDRCKIRYSNGWKGLAVDVPLDRMTVREFTGSDLGLGIFDPKAENTNVVPWREQMQSNSAKTTLGVDPDVLGSVS